MGFLLCVYVCVMRDHNILLFGPTHVIIIKACMHRPDSMGSVFAFVLHPLY